MKRFLATLLALLTLAAPALAQTRALPPGEIRANGDITFGNALKLGKRDAGKTIITPDMLQILGSGSTGDASAMSAAAAGAAASRTLSDLVGFAAGNTPTIATLGALPTAPLVPNLTVSVAGYFVAADGGGGMFTWSPASTAADDGALTIKPSAVSGAGRWLRIVNGPLSIRMFGAKGDGVADDGPTIRAAYLASTALSQRFLSCPAGTFRIATQVVPTEGVVLSGGRDCLIRAANNGPDILFEAGPAGNIGFSGMTIDGNRANNSANYVSTAKAVIHLRGGVNSFVRDVSIINAPGIAVAGEGDNQDISNNVFENPRDNAVFHVGKANAYAKNLSVRGNRVTGSMRHGINIGFSEGFDLSNNVVIGHALGLRATMRVNVSGATVTFSGGPENFQNVLPGEFLVMNRGQEWHITGKIDDNTVVVAPNGGVNPPQGNNQVAVIGSGDLFGMDGVRNGKAQANLVGNSATFGAGILSSGGLVRNVLFANNSIFRTGKHGFVISAEATGAVIERVKLLGNAFDEAGAGSDAVSDFERTSIVVVAGPGSVSGTSIDGTAASSDTSSYGPVLNWLGFDLNMTPGTVTLGKANVSTVLNGRTIVNDVKSITLSAGWGSTATTDSIVSTGDRVDFRIVSAGSGFAGFPSGTISKVSDLGPSPAIQGFVRSAGGNSDISRPFISDGAAAGSWPFLWANGTAPTASTVLATSFVAH
ncbi:glycosyl hydrolase family 28-related protein [Methylorubrum thiocyanatum]|uniref:glycosyl hydrolase family 28-related protein n=1 Tax=Methylorubrum thiocyanatum TaxID=47958 RepID=UPI003664BDC5